MAPVIRALKENPDLNVTYTTLYDENFGLSDEILDNTDVLIWWAHISHDAVPDSLADKVVERIQRGMGCIFLHSAHKSKPFMKIMGTTGTLRWRNGDFCRLWNTCPTHPIAAGAPEYIDLPEEEMYGEYFDIPKPDDVVFTGWFRGGEVFRSGCTWIRGYGKVFYFQPGHETNTAYYNPDILRILVNAVRWAAPVMWRDSLNCPNVLESPEAKYIN
ncbi:MAG: ThuA domain-containing protein [Parasporobacterium sp.]|nr:ThuA domain-containing protein [Parasporobacterium sp.]